jgi:uncharacterized membrane protein (DUF106 family)
MSTSLIIAIISEIVTIIVAIFGCYITVRVLLAKHEEKFNSHDEKFSRLKEELDEIKENTEKGLEELKDERKEIRKDIKELTLLVNKIYAKVGVLDERTKK